MNDVADIGPWEATLARLWQAQSAHSKKANQLKRSRISWTGPLLISSFSGVVIGTLSPLIPGWNEALAGPKWIPTGVGLLGAILVGASALLSRELLGPKDVRAWVAARLIAERLKAEGYRYAAGAFPYQDAEAAPELLAQRIDELTKPSGDLGALPDADPAVRTEHPHDRLDEKGYIALRAERQITKHLEDARDYSDRLKFWRSITIGLGLLSVVIGGVGSVIGKAEITIWMAVVTTATATVTAYVFGARFEFLASSYYATATRLRNRITLWEAARKRDAAALNGFIADCEAILSALNEAWAGELTKKAQASIQQTPARKPRRRRPTT